MNGFDVPLVPGGHSGLVPWVFGSSKGQSAQVAGALGLPFVASYHITPGTALEAVDAYREAFQPSAALPAPYVVASADVVVADDSATARHLASSYGHWVYSIRACAVAAPYPDPNSCGALAEDQLEVVKDRTATQFVGDPDEVADRLAALQRVSSADELVVTSVTHRHGDRLRSHELLADRWGISAMTAREGRHRKPVHLAAHFPGVNNTTVWTDPSSAARSSSSRSCTWPGSPSAACSTSSSWPKGCGCASTGAASTTSTSSGAPTRSRCWPRWPA